MKKRGPDNIQEYVYEKILEHADYKTLEVNGLRRALTKLQKSTIDKCPSCRKEPLDHVFFLGCDVCYDVINCTRVDCRDERQECHKCKRKCCTECSLECGQRCGLFTCIICSNGVFCMGCRVCDFDLGIPCSNHEEVLQPHTFIRGDTFALTCSTCREFWIEEEPKVMYGDERGWDMQHEMRRGAEFVEEVRAKLFSLTQNKF